MKFDRGYFLFSIICKLNLVMGKFYIFNRKWLSNEKLSWLKEFKGDKQKVMCRVCKSDRYATHGRKRIEVSYERQETQEEHLIVQLPVQLRCLHFYTKKLVQVSCDQRSESSANCAKANIDEFKGASAGKRWSINCQA